MAAACNLLDAGRQVTLIEKRPYLGGRAFSFTDRETGQEVDNGQHIFLGCCTYYIDFLKKLGTFRQAHLQSKMLIKVLSPGRIAGQLSTAPLPKPLHLLPSFLTYRHLGLKDKALALYALTRIALTNRNNPALSTETFGHWLKKHHQTQRSIDNFWNIIVKPCVNDDVSNVTAAMAMMVFQEGMMKTRHGSSIGYSKVGLSALMGQAAQEYIRRYGGQLITGRAVLALQADNSGIKGVELAGGETIRGDVYISALPFDDLAPLLPPELERAPYFASLRGLATAPIVNIHLWYDKQVMHEDFAAFVDSPLQWVFNKSSILGQNGAGGQYITISLSGAFEYINQPKEVLQQTFVEAMAQAFPKAKLAKVERILVVKQEKATFRCLPGSERLRPKAETPIENLFLAGEWTDTGWPSTMESAVRSGVAAAQAVVSRSNG